MHAAHVRVSSFQHFSSCPQGVTRARPLLERLPPQVHPTGVDELGQYKRSGGPATRRVFVTPGYRHLQSSILSDLSPVHRIHLVSPLLLAWLDLPVPASLHLPCALPWTTSPLSTAELELTSHLPPWRKHPSTTNMRDRLGHLQRALTDSEGFSAVELSGPSDQVEESNPDLDGILKEAQGIRLEIQQIQDDISELKDVNYQAINKSSFAVATKRDSNAIGVDVKRRGEAVLQQLHRMNAVREELEAQRGSSDPAARVARTQYHYLSNALREVMFSYNNTEMSHREACKRHIQRQMEVVGREVSEKELDEMMEAEEPCVFSVQETGHTTRSALMSIESRHRELQELERRIEGIQELFLDVAVLVEEQGAGVERIERNVQVAEVTVQEGTAELDKAIASDKNHPFKKLFCGCFPCYHN